MTNFYFVFVDPVTANNPNFDGCECVSGNSSFYCCQPISVYRFSELGKKFQMHLLEISVKTKKQHGLHIHFEGSSIDHALSCLQGAAVSVEE